MKKRRHSKQSAAARKGWATRRKRAAQQFKKRSKASKKGWKRRKAAEVIRKAPPAKGKLAEWLVTYKYGKDDQGRGKKKRRGHIKTVDFTAIARNKINAEKFVMEAIENVGADSNGKDLSWMQKIPWDEVTSMKMPPEVSEYNAEDIKTLGEKYVEIR